MKKVLIGVGVIVALVVAIVVLKSVFVGGSLNPFKSGINVYSSGWRTGYVLKLSEKGTVAKTFEGQLLLGYEPRGIESTPVTSALWEFSLVGDRAGAIAAELESAARQGVRVMLHYEELRLTTLGQDTAYNVVKVEPVNNAQ